MGRLIDSLACTRAPAPPAAGEALTLADIEAMDGDIVQTALDGTTGQVQVSFSYHSGAERGHLHLHGSRRRSWAQRAGRLPGLPGVPWPVLRAQSLLTDQVPVLPQIP